MNARAVWIVTLAAGVCAAMACDAILQIHDLTPPDGAVLDASPDALGDGGATCGTFGRPCCDSGCTDGTECSGDGGRCVAFAGMYEKVGTNTCGVNPLCVYPNPVTGDCTCPSAQQSSEIDVACGDAAAPQHLSGALGVCGASTMPPGSDWGGAYVRADIPSCVPAYDGGCLMPNPMTGACSCPDLDAGTADADAGMETVSFRVFVPGAVQDGGCQNGYLGGVLDVCLPTAVQPTSVFGAYQRDATGVCRTWSQSLTGCSCPGNTTPSQLRSIQEAPAGCSTQCSFPESTITFCLRL